MRDREEKDWGLAELECAEPHCAIEGGEVAIGWIAIAIGESVTEERRAGMACEEVIRTSDLVGDNREITFFHTSIPPAGLPFFALTAPHDSIQLHPGLRPITSSNSRIAASERYKMAITVLSPADCLANISNLKGKVVIITGALDVLARREFADIPSLPFPGAGSGFGREAALRFASYGAHVVVSDLNMAPLESLVKEIERNHSG